MKVSVLFLALAVLSVGANARTVYKQAQLDGYTAFIAVVDAAGFKSILDNPNFKGTVMVPSNEAAAAFLASANLTLAQAIKQKELMKAVLSYHMIAGDVLYRKTLGAIQDWGTYSAASPTLTIVKPLGKLRFYFGTRTLTTTAVQFAGSAKALKEDVPANRAVMHYINRVMVPPLPTAGK